MRVHTEVQALRIASQSVSPVCKDDVPHPSLMSPQVEQRRNVRTASRRQRVPQASARHVRCGHLPLRGRFSLRTPT